MNQKLNHEGKIKNLNFTQQARFFDNAHIECY